MVGVSFGMNLEIRRFCYRFPRHSNSSVWAGNLDEMKSVFSFYFGRVEVFVNMQNVRVSWNFEKYLLSILLVVTTKTSITSDSYVWALGKKVTSKRDNLCG